MSRLTWRCSLCLSGPGTFIALPDACQENIDEISGFESVTESETDVQSNTKIETRKTSKIHFLSACQTTLKPRPLDSRGQYVSKKARPHNSLQRLACHQAASRQHTSALCPKSSAWQTDFILLTALTHVALMVRPWQCRHPCPVSRWYVCSALNGPDALKAGGDCLAKPTRMH
jgi:hypothetical protein